MHAPTHFTMYLLRMPRTVLPRVYISLNTSSVTVIILAPLHCLCISPPSMNCNVLFKGWLFLSLPFDRLRRYTKFYALKLYFRTLTEVLVVPISTKELSPLVLHLIYEKYYIRRLNKLAADKICQLIKSLLYHKLETKKCYAITYFERN